jgi:hypothetical protein
MANGALVLSGCEWSLPQPQGTLLVESFSGDLSAQWVSFGEPRPLILTDMGNPPPCFDNNGDASYDSGVISKASFDFSEGLVIEADIYVQADEDGCWTGAEIGLLLHRDFSDYLSPGCSVRFAFSYAGTLCNSHSGAGIGCRIMLADGTREEHAVLGQEDLLGAWHHFTIAIDPSRHVVFSIDGETFYETNGVLAIEHTNMQVILGHRSYVYGVALHDNVVVSSYPATRLPVGR